MYMETYPSGKHIICFYKVMRCDPVLSKILYGFREGLDWRCKIGFGYAERDWLSCFDTCSHVVWDMDGTSVRVVTLQTGLAEYLA